MNEDRLKEEMAEIERQAEQVSEELAKAVADLSAVVREQKRQIHITREMVSLISSFYHSGGSK